MANLTTQTISRAGIGPTFAAAAGGGDTFTPDVDTFIEVKNAAGSPITVTVVTPRTDPESGQAIADVSVSVPATTGDRMIGPFPAHSFADPTDGLADITYSSATSVTVAVFKLQE
jgi:hypothetical protein